MTPGEQARLTAWVEGRVQGVGFRWWARARALELGLSGWAENLEAVNNDVARDLRTCQLDRIPVPVGPW